ncbi:MAG TPA: DUF4112 domain-containing protein [Blastocatellia bacterium]|nr:DUF4112 domain-containing protein [Blastocatellia bacterium]
MGSMNDSNLILAENDMSALSPERRAGIDYPDRIAWLLDDLIRIPIINKRIGLDPIIGLIPGAGDAVTTLLGLYIVGSAVYYRLPKLVLLRMGLNVVIDALVGMIPVVGDAGDFFIKSNRWNMNLLRRYAGERRQPGLSDYLFVGSVLAVVVAVIAASVWLAGASLLAGFNFLRSINLF